MCLSIYSGTDDLVAKLYVDASVFVPSYLVQCLAVELLNAAQLPFIIFRFSQIDNMVTHTRNQLDGTVGQDMYLFYLGFPKRVIL